VSTKVPAVSNSNGKGKEGRGIGSHTDHGLLIIAAQDDVVPGHLVSFKNTLS
jgi:isopenicillin N synthase-like dioxygenase